MRKQTDARFGWLKKVRNEKAEEIRHAQKLPIAVFQCGKHPEARVVFGEGELLVPQELRCVLCGSRIKPKVIEPL